MTFVPEWPFFWGWNFHIFTSPLIISSFKYWYEAICFPLSPSTSMFGHVSLSEKVRKREERNWENKMTKHDRERAKVRRRRERAWQEGRELWHALICANRSSLGKQPGFVDSQKAPSAIYPSLSITCYYSSGPLPLLHQWHLHNNYARQSQSITEIYIDASMSRTLVDAAALSN